MQQFNDTFRNIAESCFYIGNYFLTKEAVLHTERQRKSDAVTLDQVKKKMKAERTKASTSGYFLKDG